MKPCDTDLLLARAQVFLATLLVLGFFGVLAAVLFVIGVHKIELSGSTLSLVTTGLTAAITMASGAAGYFFLRHRPQTAADDDGDSLPASPKQPDAAAEQRNPTQPPQAAK